LSSSASLVPRLAFRFSLKSDASADPARARAAINGLFRQLENPSNYKPEEFARQMQAVRTLLHQ
jgi:hypothetical protein